MASRRECLGVLTKLRDERGVHATEDARLEQTLPPNCLERAGVEQALPAGRRARGVEQQLLAVRCGIDVLAGRGVLAESGACGARRPCPGPSWAAGRSGQVRSCSSRADCAKVWPQ
mmetsp:Transcript_6524/g.18655  ORF Transcript_6524/g.18655 Transcript_6524/m.18655 type:complete len:116 (-) Transcript_6524:538-885(-)